MEDKECIKCDDIIANTSRISVLESQFTVVEKHTSVVDKLTTKVSLLLTIMSFIICIVSAGAIYTFTGLSDFRLTYANDRIALNNHMADNQDKNRELFQSSIAAISKNVDNRFRDLELSLHGIDQKIIRLETRLEENNRKK